jgi:hypothetical protein
MSPSIFNTKTTMAMINELSKIVFFTLNLPLALSARPEAAETR